MNLVLLGPPGAGKGTQATRLSQEFGVRHLSSGDVLRAERQAGTELGSKVAAFMDAGELVPDEIIIKVILGQVNAEESGVLLDGFPRTRNQAERLLESMEAHDTTLDAVICLEVPDSDIVNRITGRRICPKCGEVYHVSFRPPVKPDVCDHDGETLIHRQDDTEEVVKQRLQAYHELTEPVKEYYRDRGLLRIVDGTQSVDAVGQASVDAVKAARGV